MLIQADARALPLTDASVDCVVTSPPYFGLRDYGNTDQIGLERSPAEYVAALVAVFTEVRRVLKPEGVCWLNLGDSYASTTGTKTSQPQQSRNGQGVCGPRDLHPSAARGNLTAYKDFGDMKPKDLMGIPWRVAFALQADGWYLRSDIIWHKPNPMPESVTDRPTKAHEYLFLLTKSERYYYDADAIAELATHDNRELFRGHDRYTGGNSFHNSALKAASGKGHVLNEKGTRNRRSVWTVPTMPYAGAHFATMPEKLVEPCILAGCPMGGLVLDPFVGSGTVVAVAQRLGRLGVGVDLSYQDLSKERTAQRGLRW